MSKEMMQELRDLAIEGRFTDPDTGKMIFIFAFIGGESVS